LIHKEESYTYKVILSYRGTQYRGWQNQTSSPETIQNYVEQVIKKIAKHKDFKVIGASRTDSGVHALGQVLKIVLPREIDPTKLLLGMNSKLPNDIRVIECDFINSNFNVNQDSLFKEYHYYFTIDQRENAMISEMSYPYPEKLNIELMHKACELITGEHNFHSFSYPGPNPPKPIREVLECSIEKTNFLSVTDHMFYLKIRASGFLRYMIRYLMGAVWDVGCHKLSLDELKESLNSGKDVGIRTKAPALGLHLIHIEY